MFLIELTDKLLYKQDNRKESRYDWEGVVKSREDVLNIINEVLRIFNYGSSIGLRFLKFKTRFVKDGYEIRIETPNTKHDLELEVLGLHRSKF